MQLTTDEIEYLRFLYTKFEFEIENDIAHCEPGSESLFNKVLSELSEQEEVEEEETNSNRKRQRQ